MVFCILFLALFTTLIAIIPSEFFALTKEYKKYEYPEYFSQADIQSIKHFLNKTVSKGGETEFDFAGTGANFYLKVIWHEAGEVVGEPDVLSFNRLKWAWWIFRSWSVMEIDVYGQYLSKSEALSEWDNETKASIIHPVYDDALTVKIWLTDTNKTRKDLRQAWDEGTIMVGIGFGFEDYETKLSVWDIIGKLLTFQSPEVFGLSGPAATVLNLLIALPLWIVAAYLIYRLILMAIPFV